MKQPWFKVPSAQFSVYGYKNFSVPDANNTIAKINVTFIFGVKEGEKG